MESQNAHKCPECGSVDTGMLALYNTVHNGDRRLFFCKTCQTRFSETKKTVMENTKTPISKVASALKLRSEGLGLRATGRPARSLPKGVRVRVKNKGSQNHKKAANVQNIKPLSGNIQIQIKTYQIQTYMQIILKRIMLQSGGGIVPLEEERICMQKQKKAYSELLMFT
jgi:transposase-like protein